VGDEVDEVAEVAAPDDPTALLVDIHPDGAVTLRTVDHTVALHYTPGEWHAYLTGLHTGEFPSPPDRAGALSPC
jgi:hypothetical protein